jgi:hypothetical protein
MRTISTIAFCATLIGLGCGLANAVTTVCVNAGDAADFQTQLNNAVTSGAATTLEVPRGTYHLGGNQLVFTATAVSQGQLDISGGFSSDCSTHIDNPALTIIDGDNLSGVLSIMSTGGVSVRYLTIQNGLKADRAGLNVVISGGGLIIDYNIIRNNRATDETAGLDATITNPAATDMHIAGNLIAGNSANTNVSGAAIENDGAGDSYITNNTVANNVISGPLANGFGGLVAFGNTFASNNVFWGNTSLDINADGAALVDNDYGTLGGTPSSNSGSQSVDPQFVGNGNFQLASTSPLLAQGTISPAGGLPTIDILGHDREYDATTATVDMGAYERGDEIFGNSYDN